MCPTGVQVRYASISIHSQEDDKSLGTAQTVFPSVQDDSSEPEDESDADDPDESNSGAGGAGMPDFGEPGDSDDSGASSDSDGSSEDGDSNSGEHEQMEESSAAAVLDLPELLHMIICEVPREHRTMLRRVSRNWKAAVEKIGYVFQPNDIGHGPYREDDPMPLYTSQAIFRSDPVFLDSLFSTRGPADQVNPGYLIKYRCLGPSRSIPHFVSVAELSENGHQFVTHPPLTELPVQTGSLFDPRIRVQVDGEIRLKDLLDFFQTVHRGGEVALFHGCSGGPKEFFPSKLDEKSGEGSLDEFGDGAGGDGSADSGAPDEPVDESEGDNFGASEGGAEGDEPAESSAPDGGSEKDDVKAGGDDQVEASSKVLLTNELLQMIITEVPRKDRTSLRRISKTWQGAVVEVGYALEPISYERLLFSKEGYLPMYGPPRTISKMNPAWPRTYAIGDKNNQDTYFLEYAMSDYPPSATAKLAAHAREFVTDPPITQLIVATNSRKGDTAAILRVRRGIRIGDLAACCEKMKATGVSKNARVAFTFSNEGMWKEVMVTHKSPGNPPWRQTEWREVPENGPEPEDEEESSMDGLDLDGVDALTQLFARLWQDASRVNFCYFQGRSAIRRER